MPTESKADGAPYILYESGNNSVFYPVISLALKLTVAMKWQSFLYFAGISHAASPSKDKANLVDEGHAGQFHKVLVEPDYSVPGPPVVKEDPHNTATLKIG